MSNLSADVRGLFESANYAHFATLLPDGSPHNVPMWVDLEGDQIAVLTSPGSRKARNVARDPRVAISITDQTQPNRMAFVRGRIAERVEGDEAWKIIDRMAHKYIGQDYPLRSDRIVLLIEAEHSSAFSF